MMMATFCFCINLNYNLKRIMRIVTVSYNYIVLSLCECFSLIGMDIENVLQGDRQIQKLKSNLFFSPAIQNRKIIAKEPIFLFIVRLIRAKLAYSVTGEYKMIFYYHWQFYCLMSGVISKEMVQ